MTDEEVRSHAEPIPEKYRDWNRRLWFARPNDLIGGWCIMTVDKPPSQCDFHEGELEVGSFMDELTARRIVGLHNAALASIPIDRVQHLTHRDEAADKAFGTPIELLREWFEWWEQDENVPVKMPDALHVRTACALYIATGEHPLERRARKPAPAGMRQRLLGDLAQEKPLVERGSQKIVRQLLTDVPPFGVTGAVFRLEADLARTAPGDPHAEDLARVLGEFQDMRDYLHRELIETDAAAALDDDLDYLEGVESAPRKRSLPKSLGMGKNGPADLSERGMDPMKQPVVPLEQLYALIEALRDHAPCDLGIGSCLTHDLPVLMQDEKCPHLEAREVIDLVDEAAHAEADRILDEAEAHAASAERVAAAVKRAAAELNARQAGGVVLCENPEAGYIEQMQGADELALRRIKANFKDVAPDGCVRTKAPEDLQSGEAVIAYNTEGVEADALVAHIRTGNPPRNRVAHLVVDFATTRPVVPGE